LFGKYKQGGKVLNKKQMRKFPIERKMVNGNIKCSIAAFGRDPTPGQ